jgi:hypothetical protein
MAISLTGTSAVSDKAVPQLRRNVRVRSRRRDFESRGHIYLRTGAPLRAFCPGRRPEEAVVELLARSPGDGD